MAKRLLVAAFALMIAAALAGCVSIPTGGPVMSSTVTQGPGGQGQHYMQLVPNPPVDGWDPEEIVTGFLAASGSFGYRQVAEEYLAPAARKWNPAWSAFVYSKGPVVNAPVYQAVKGSGKSATQMAEVTIGGTVQAKLSGTGGYAVPQAPQKGASAPVEGPPTFGLVKVGGQWRISSAPPRLLLSSYMFNLDYQSRNLYFFDPNYSYLVPDPAYVPLQATPVDLMTGLVKDLIKQPSDWLLGATTTAFPDGTTLNDVTLNGGTAIVNLSIPRKALEASKQSTARLKEMSAQLLYTLSAPGQSGSAVQSVELSVNGVPWSPPGSQQNPVQPLSQEYAPRLGTSGDFYYLDSAGWLVDHNIAQGTTRRLVALGQGYSQIAVSPGAPGSQYVAALKGGVLYAGPLGKLTRQPGRYLSMSWDPDGNLWATNTGNLIVEMPAPDSSGQPLGQPVTVEVVNSDGTLNLAPFSAVRVAPDGVRMAIVVQGSGLNFGAINYPPQGPRTSSTIVKIELSPFYVSQVGSATFGSVSWYGPDDVITLSEPNQALAEYPVNGGSPTAMPSPDRIQSITASYGSPLIAGLANGSVMANSSLTGAWPNAPIIKKGFAPVYPG